MAKTLALVFGVVFILVGILGFVPNPLVGADALFATDALHNIVHILFGVILLVTAKKAPALWLLILGVVYLVLAVLGFLLVPDEGALLGLVHVNTADHWLHVVLGVVLVAAGFFGKKQAAPAM
jgi:uncharacterized membrane protein HdeD (DUF308 family)